MWTLPSRTHTCCRAEVSISLSVCHRNTECVHAIDCPTETQVRLEVPKDEDALTAGEGAVTRP
jgi:hypothetical protein